MVTGRARDVSLPHELSIPQRGLATNTPRVASRPWGACLRCRRLAPSPRLVISFRGAEVVAASFPPDGSPHGGETGVKVVVFASQTVTCSSPLLGGFRTPVVGLGALTPSNPVISGAEASMSWSFPTAPQPCSPSPLDEVASPDGADTASPFSFQA